MTRLSDPVSLWTEAQLELLIAQKEPEGQRLEYKRELSLETPRQRIEAAKDLTGFANAAGGRLIFGIAEGDTTDGFKVPTRIVPLTDGSRPDRLQDSITGICQPRPSYTPHRIDVEGGYCLAIEIPMAALPIMVAAGDRENRYYRRYNTQVLAMGEREVREGYERLAASRGAVDRLLAEADPLEDLPDTEQQFYREADWRRLRCGSACSSCRASPHRSSSTQPSSAALTVASNLRCKHGRTRAPERMLRGGLDGLLVVGGRRVEQLPA